MSRNPYLPHTAIILERIQETPTIFTLRLRFRDKQVQDDYHFEPGQFNMVYLPGGGEVPISISSDPYNQTHFDHTIRTVGRVTTALSQLKVGDAVGIRGAFGRSWPLNLAENKDVILLTGGLGCAPVASVTRYMVKRREQFGWLNIMQGVKHTDDLIWAEQYDVWAQLANTEVILAASEEKAMGGHWHSGHVTNLIDKAKFDPANTIVMMCGPEPMMWAAINPLKDKGVPEDAIWLSMERNMQCAVGHCGHCQYGEHFICKNGPVFPFSEIHSLFGKAGF